MSTVQLNRYPGAQPFEKEYKNQFFGRETVTTDLYRKAKLEQLVVLYSKSGLGKSSLLNAGIIPKTEEEGKYQAVRIRLGAWTERETRTPVQIMLEQLMNGDSRSTFLDKLLKNEQTLWHEVKEFQIARTNARQSPGLMLIFDQFEELFTYPEASVLAFKQQLREALFENLPQRYADELAKHFDSNQEVLSHAEMDLLQVQPDLKVILAIRSDRMSLLDGLSDYLPNILKHCFELSALTKEEAVRAVVEPARLELPHLITPRFEYSQEAVEKILSFLSKKGTQLIESFQLQILCQSIEEQVTSPGQLITIEDLDDENLDTLYENYYDNQIQRLNSEHERMTARALIEDGLIYSVEERRLSLYEGVITEEYKVSKETLQKLVSSHLLRAEPSMQGGGYTYELSHDTLVKPVLQSRRRRREALREENTLLYEQMLEAVPEAERLATRRLVEEDMVYEERELRIQLYDKQILKRIQPATLERLLEIGLLRGEHNAGMGFQYQLTNADMVTGVLAAKNKRLAEEAEERQREEAAQKAKELSELREKAAEEERKREEAERLKLLAETAQTEAEDQRNKALASKRRANMFAITTAVLLIGVSVLAVLAVRYAEQNKQAKLKIISETFKTDELRVQDLMKNAATLEANNYAPSAKAAYQEAYNILNNDGYKNNPDLSIKSQANERLKDLEARILACELQRTNQ